MAEPGARRVTSADVARLAGVSRATVSYVLNDTPRQTISADTRTRVLDAAARLGYAPSAAARTLRTGRSEVVLCLLPDWPIGPEVGTLLGGLSTELARAGLTFVVHPGNREDRPISEIWKAITPAAVIAFTDFSPDEMAAMRSAGVALVVALLGRDQLLGREQLQGREQLHGREQEHGREQLHGREQEHGRGQEHGRVQEHDRGQEHGRRPEDGQRGGEQPRRRELEVPQQLIGRRQVEHLRAAGHTRLGYAYPDDERLRIFAEPRLAGVRSACRSGGLAEPVRETVALGVEQASEAVRRWRAAGITAVCAYNDEVALAVLAGARRLGLAVPAELAVIGVDDIPPARLAAPPLTTVTTDQALVAAHLRDTVLAAMSGRPGPVLPIADLVGVVRRESA